MIATISKISTQNSKLLTCALRIPESARESIRDLCRRADGVESAPRAEDTGAGGEIAGGFGFADELEEPLHEPQRPGLVHFLPTGRTVTKVVISRKGLLLTVVLENADCVERGLQPLGELRVVALRAGGLVVDDEEAAPLGPADAVRKPRKHHVVGEPQRQPLFERHGFRTVAGEGVTEEAGEHFAAQAEVGLRIFLDADDDDGVVKPLLPAIRKSLEHCGLVGI